MKRFFVLWAVFLLILAGTAQGEDEFPANWKKPWDRNFQLEIGTYNPKNYTDHHTWEGGKKFAVDWLPVDWDGRTPIKVYSPVDGKIVCMNLFNAEPEGSTSGTSCQRGHSGSDKSSGTNNPYGAYGQHIIIEPDEKFGGPNYTFIIAHLDRNTDGLEIQASDKRVRKGELIGYLGNTGYSVPNGTYHIHFEFNKRSTWEEITVFGLNRDAISKTGDKYYGEFPEIFLDNGDITGTYVTEAGYIDHIAAPHAWVEKGHELRITRTSESPNKMGLALEGDIPFQNGVYVSFGNGDVVFSKEASSVNGLNPYWTDYIYDILPTLCKAEIELHKMSTKSGDWNVLQLIVREKLLFVTLCTVDVSFQKTTNYDAKSSARPPLRNGLFRIKQ